jgi:hypothetical protein
MPGPEVLLPLALFFGMALLAVALVWRVVVVGGQARVRSQRRQAAVAIAGAAAVSLGRLAEVIDGVRRRTTPPDEADKVVAAAAEEMQRYRTEAAALVRSGSLAEPAAGLAAEIARGERAIELVARGLELLTRRSSSRLGEGETDVKRGYVGLLQAREALESKAREIAALAEPARRSWRRLG